MSAEALERLGASTAVAVSGVLETFCPDGVKVGDVTVTAEGDNPFAGVPVPAVACSVSYVDGVTGGNVFAMPRAAASRLAAAMMGQEPPASDAELDEMALSAVAEAMNQMMAAAAAATGAVLGQEVEISPPATSEFTDPAAALDGLGEAAHTLRVPFTVMGEPCRLVQLVPNAFLVRMARALDELGAAELAHGTVVADPAESEALTRQLRDVPVRVWAELGRARMRAQRVVDLPAGAVVELDRGVDEPIDLYVNGMPFATGRLVVTEGSDWAVRIDSVAGTTANTEGDG